jgi:serine/threonine-protein kinase
MIIDQQGKLIWRNLAKVSDQFADFLDKMVEYDHTNRYANATEALTALQQISQPQSNNHQPANTDKKINPGFLKFASIGLVILVTGIIIFVFFNRRLPECGGKVSTYQNSEYNIKLAYPECWNKDTTPNALDNKIVTFIQPQQNARLTISSFEYRGTLDQFQHIREQDITDNLEAGKVTKTDRIYFSDKEGRKIIATGKNGDNNIKNMYVMTLKENKAYVIIYSAKENDYDKFLKTVETIIQSIRIQ